MNRKISLYACALGCLEIGVKWFLFSFRDLGAVFGFTSPLDFLAVSHVRGYLPFSAYHVNIPTPLKMGCANVRKPYLMLPFKLA